MSTTDVLEIIGVLVSILGVGFMAASEVGITRMTKIRAYHLAEEGRRGSASLLKIVENPPPYLNVVLLLTLIFTIGGTTVATDLATQEPGECRRDHRHGRHDAAAVHLRGGHARRRTRSSTRTDWPSARRRSSTPSAGCSDRSPKLPRQAGLRDHAGQGPPAGAVRDRAGDPHDGGRRVGGGTDRGGREGAHPLDLRVRRHDRARGHGSPPRHRGSGGGQVAPRRPGPDRPVGILTPSRVPGRARRHRRHRLRQGRPPGDLPGQVRRPARADHPARALRPGGEEGRRAAPRDAAAEVPHRDGVRRARLGLRAGHDGGPHRGAGRRDRRRVRRGTGPGGGPSGRLVPGRRPDADRRDQRAARPSSSPTTNGTRSAA